MSKSLILTTKLERDYELIDSGENEKLERYGQVILRRPDPQALWPKTLSDKEWNNIDGIFSEEGWRFGRSVPEEWQIEFGKLKFNIHPSAFKHTGIFPEQLGNWSWLTKVIEDQRSPQMTGQAKIKDHKETNINVLNLFGYTGGATLACAKAGATVCHVDASKKVIGWARDNAELSGLSSKPIRWILDDAVAFVRREIRRGNKYDGIIMDPPAFGHGPGGEMWLIEKDFLFFVEECKQLLSDKPLFFLINGYASGYSAIAYENNLLDLKKNFGGEIEKGELTIEEKSGRLLPCGIFARWFSREKI